MSHRHCERSEAIHLLKSIKARNLLLITLIGLIIPHFCEAQNGEKNLTPSILKTELGSLHAINLKSGDNTVFFSGINREVRISAASQNPEDGTSTVYFVTINQNSDTNSGNNPDWTVIPLDDNLDYTTEDDSDAGFFSRYTRFMNGTLNGIQETFLFTAILTGPIHGIESPHAIISVETLQTNAIGFPPFQFLPILTFQTKARYMDAAQALEGELSIPVPSGYVPGS